ncbi:hypothetical protein FACS1894103_3280 [Campylobacterota bacterium]|nr:hypothetical protein FACS1894103_3280 [Campylobacterota bacterium]
MSANAVLSLSLSLSLWVLLLTALFSLTGCGSSDGGGGGNADSTNYCPNRNNPIVFTPSFTESNVKLTIPLDTARGTDIKNYQGMNFYLYLDDGVGDTEKIPSTRMGASSPLTAHMDRDSAIVDDGDSIECTVITDEGADYNGKIKCGVRDHTKESSLYEGKWDDIGTINMIPDRSYQKLRIYVNSTESTSGSVGAACGYYSISIDQTNKKFVTSPMPYTPETQGRWWE